MGVLKNQFIYIVKPIKENFEKTATDEDNKIVGEHFLYLKNLLEVKKLILGGPQVKAKFGIVVFEADSEEEANYIMQNDPALERSFLGRTFSFQDKPSKNLSQTFLKTPRFLFFFEIQCRRVYTIS